ncbi:hypothetical protein KEM56_000397 [Ascosphaera pollenicola]|nr:hypothetical protein KEM56_000397 [Ascosphaera pollenicola]
MGCVASSTADVDADDKLGYANAVYYPNWKVYNGKQPSAIDLRFVSHIFYAFALVKEDGTIYLSDPWADLEMPLEDGTQGCLRHFTKEKAVHDGLKLILSVGGANGSEYFASIAGDAGKTATFVQSAKDLAATHNLDGFDIDWEHPTNPREGDLYATLIERMREAFPAPRYTLTTALSAGTWVLRNIKLQRVIKSLDFINLMTYDFAGPWCPKSGHHAQLFTANDPHDENAALSCQSALQYIHSMRVPMKKVLLGIPVYGRSFPGTTSIGQTPASGAEHKEFDYCDLPLPDTEEQEDDSVGAGWCVDESAGFISYDTPRIVQQKARFARTRDMGGLFYWHAAADGEGPRNLVRAGYNALWNIR